MLRRGVVLKMSQEKLIVKLQAQVNSMTAKLNRVGELCYPTLSLQLHATIIERDKLKELLNEREKDVARLVELAAANSLDLQGDDVELSREVWISLPQYLQDDIEAREQLMLSNIEATEALNGEQNG